MFASVVPAPGMPAAFFGHGSPLNTITTNRYTHAWRAYAAGLPVPRAILVVSAHWYVAGTRISAAPCAATIHDFNANFPRELFDLRYPAPGDAALVERVIELARPVRVQPDAVSWGIDHGAYSILVHAFPRADIPVVQLSIDRSKPPAYHYDLAQRLAPLRDEGVFIMGSGNIVHNVELSDRTADGEPYPWARRFETLVRELLEARDHASLVRYHRLGPDARLAVPTPDHYLPLLYTIGVQRDADQVKAIVDGFGFRSIGMLSIDIAA